MVALKKTLCKECCGCVYLLPACPGQDPGIPDQASVPCNVLEAILDALPEPQGDVVCPPTGSSPLYGVDITPPHQDLVILSVSVGGQHGCYFYCRPDEERVSQPPSGVPVIQEITSYDFQSCAFICELWCPDGEGNCGGEGQPPHEVITGCLDPNKCLTGLDPSLPGCFGCNDFSPASIRMEMSLKLCACGCGVQCECQPGWHPDCTAQPTVDANYEGTFTATAGASADHGPPIQEACVIRHTNSSSAADQMARHEMTCGTDDVTLIVRRSHIFVSWLVEVWCAVLDGELRWRVAVEWQAAGWWVEATAPNCPGEFDAFDALHFIYPNEGWGCTGSCFDREPADTYLQFHWGPPVEWLFDPDTETWRMKKPQFSVNGGVIPFNVQIDCGPHQGPDTLTDCDATLYTMTIFPS